MKYLEIILLIISIILMILEATNIINFNFPIFFIFIAILNFIQAWLNYKKKNYTTFRLSLICGSLFTIFLILKIF